MDKDNSNGFYTLIFLIPGGFIFVAAVLAVGMSINRCRDKKLVVKHAQWKHAQQAILGFFYAIITGVLGVPREPAVKPKGMRKRKRKGTKIRDKHAKKTGKLTRK